MGILRNIYFKVASEETLRKKSRKIRRKIDKLDYDSKRHTRLSNKSVDFVNAVASKSKGKLPRREHGWYISKDD
jgi:hypothetical protein